ncbi:MAG TPA: exopolysaccharide biosynthesis polyprenyl glycosylphosphotransferase [Candidatus Absconditabacterales bacterium]|nr:exopolysaccharide biosynthesis polyprenyl glycosylphosphotransferase [Candidatus Absconditabacterales bacterium]
MSKKRKNKDYNIPLRLIRPIIHMIIILVIFFLIYKLRLVTDLIPGVQLPIPPINYEETMLFAFISSFAFIGIGIIKNLYELNKPTQKYFQTYSKVRIYRIITITFVGYFGSGFVFEYGVSRFIILFGAIISFFVIFLFDQIRNKIESIKHRNGKNKILIIGDNSPRSYEAIEKIKEGFSFKTEFIQLKDIGDIKVTDYFIIVAVGIFPKELLQDTFEKIRFSTTRFYHISEGYFLEDVVYKPENISNLIAMEYKHSKLDGRSIVLKRIFDIIVSLIAIIILSPIMLIVAITIKLESKGPIFFIQKRVGQHEEPFTFIKFRSMVKNADNMKKDLLQKNERKGPLFKIKNDPRITKFGKFLRKSSLDELPQLFCVIIGTMSIIGPRPHLPEEVQKYEIREKRLLSVKPGISGYAQVFGRDSLSFEDEAKLDLYYIHNRSIFMDLYVIFGTFKVVFKGK